MKNIISWPPLSEIALIIRNRVREYLPNQFLDTLFRHFQVFSDGSNTGLRALFIRLS